MDYKSRLKIESHDAAGYETAMDDFSQYDDGYGNRVAHGDLSMQRAIEGGHRDATWPTMEREHDGPPAPKAYDTEPFQSKAQARKFFSMEGRGQIPSGTARRWMRKTRAFGKLPERKR